jgi:hypothetical protein
MQSNLEVKKLQVELLRVGAAKAELELRIEERMDEIHRIKEHIKVSEDKEIELKEKLKELGK